MIFVCFLIIVSVLLQEDKSGGGIGIIGGSSQSFFGASSGSLLVKVSTVLVTIFLLLCVGLALISSSFTKGTVVSETDIYESESKEYEGPRKRILKDIPEKIQVTDFEKNVLDKITDEDEKHLILTSFEKNKQNKYYEFQSKKVTKENKIKILKILNNIGFSLEATMIEFDSTDTITDDEDSTKD